MKATSKTAMMTDKLKIEHMVRDIFKRRAEGELQKSIAKVHGLAQWEISSILHRKRYANVTVSYDLMSKVQDRFRKPQQKKVAQIVEPLSVAKVLSDYTVACAEFVKSEIAALDAGINTDTLDLLRVAIRENSQ